MMTELIIALLAHMPENRIVQGGLVRVYQVAAISRFESS